MRLDSAASRDRALSSAVSRNRGALVGLMACASVKLALGLTTGHSTARMAGNTTIQTIEFRRPTRVSDVLRSEIGSGLGADRPRGVYTLAVGKADSGRRLRTPLSAGLSS